MSRASLVCASSLLLLSIAGPRAQGADDPLRSEFFELDAGDMEDRESAETLLRRLERLRGDVDQLLIGGGALKASLARKKPSKPWKVYWFRTTTACRDFLGKFGSQFGAAPGTYFWAGSEFREPFLAFTPSGDHKKDLEKVLEHGTKFVLYHRIGVNMDFRRDDRGIPLLYGLAAYFRNSALPDDLSYPRRLGGCPTTAIERAQSKIVAGTFPSLEFLFTAPHHAFTGNRDELHYPSILLVEFLLEGEDMKPPVFFALLRSYRTRSIGTDGKNAYKRFLKAYRRIGSADDIHDRFQEHIRSKSLKVNRERWTNRNGDQQK